MANKFIKPKVLVSKCLGFAACRWDGEMIPGSFAEKLEGRVKYITICPEVAIGLGVPRDPIRIILERGKMRLVQLNTGKDITGIMKKFTVRFLDSLKDVDGFILKGRSPSCGIKDAKVYLSLDASRALKKTTGFFSKEVLKRFPHAIIETEERLAKPFVRKRFLAKLFKAAKRRK